MDVTAMFHRFHDRARQSIERAEGIAHAHGRNATGTEHLLLGVIADRSNAAARTLISHGISLRALELRLRTEADAPASDNRAEPSGAPPPFETHAAKVVRLAPKEANRLHHAEVGTAHLLLAIMREADNAPARVLRGFGASLDSLRGHTSRILGTDSELPLGLSAAPSSSATLSRPTGRTPSARPTAAARLIRFTATLATFATLVVGFVGLAAIVATRVGPRESGASWVVGWLFFSLLALAASAAAHWTTLRRFFSRRSLEFLAKELFDAEIEEHPAIHALDRFDHSEQAAVVDVSNAIGRWAARLFGYAVLTGAVCVWLLLSEPAPRYLWWGLGSTALAVLAFIAWRQFNGHGVVPFRYPARTSRMLPAFVEGLHSGMSGFVGVVLFVPIGVVLVHLVSHASWWEAALTGRTASVLMPISNLATAVSGEPILSALLLFVLPLALVVVVYRLTESMLAVDFSEWLLPEDMPPALYLRTWSTDAVPISLRPSGGRFLDAIVPERRSNFTESLGRNLSMIGPVVLVGEPGSRRQRGVGSLWSTDEHWRELVERYAERALVTVFAASDVPPDSGFSWEIDLVGSGLTTGRAAIVFPPGFDFDRAFEAGGYLDVASREPIFQGIHEAQPISETLLMARDRTGQWSCYDASIPDDASYAHCLYELMFEYSDRWTEGALGETDFPSTLQAQRFVTAVSGGIGVNPLTAARIVGLAYPALRRVLVFIRTLLST